MSHLNIFKTLVKLRQEPTFRIATNLRLIDLSDENIFAYTRELASDSSYLIVLNFGHDGTKRTIPYGLGTGKGEIVISSANAPRKPKEQVDFSQPFDMFDADGYVIKLLE